MSTEHALTKIEPMPSNPGVEGMITLAIERGATVETLERLMAIRREVRAEQAKEAYDRALADFQAECPTIQKTAKVMNKDGRSVRYQYAPLDAIIHQVKGILQRHGFSYSVNAKAEPTSVTAVCKLTHAHGHSESSEFAVPIDKDAYMNPAQQVASALTFAKRYAFCNACGIMTGDQDDDSQGSHEPKQPAKPDRQPEQPRTKKAANEQTRVWFLAEMRKRFDEQVLLQWAIDRKPPFIMPNEHLEDIDLKNVPATKHDFAEMVLECSSFMGVQPRQPEGRPTPPDTTGQPSDAPQGNVERTAGSLDSHEPTGGWQGAAGTNDPPDDGVESITGTLEKVSVKAGRSKKGPWTLFGVCVEGQWFNTFDRKLGELAQRDKGSVVTVFYREGERGNELVGIEPTQAH